MSRSRSPRREPLAPEQAPAQVPWWQKFKPAKPAVEDDLGYGDVSQSQLQSASANLWSKSLPPSWDPPHSLPQAPGHGHAHTQPPPPPPAEPEVEPGVPAIPRVALLLEGVPGELNSMSKVYDAFRGCGEVLNVIVFPAQGRAFVEYRDLESVNGALAALATAQPSSPAMTPYLPCKGPILVV